MNPGRGFLTVAVAAVLAASAISLLDAEEPARRSGPRDWSHRHIVSGSVAVDGDELAGHDWRTRRRQIILADARDRWASFNGSGGGGWRDGHHDGGHDPDPQDGMANWTILTGGTGPVLGYPAKFSFDVRISHCTDAIYFTVDQPGGATRPNVIGITNPYPGCPGNPAGRTPTVKFALRLPYAVPTSATLSLDGTVLYVIESRPREKGGVILHAINVHNIRKKPGAYDFRYRRWTSVHTLAPPDGTAASEQLFELTFPYSTNRSSSPFLDYESGTIYFGDSAGKVHRVAGANTPAARKDVGWPVQCGRVALEGPAFFDRQVVAGSADGKLYRIDTSDPRRACIAALQFGEGERRGDDDDHDGDRDRRTDGSAYTRSGDHDDDDEDGDRDHHDGDCDDEHRGRGGLTAPIVDVTNHKILIATGDTVFGDFKAVAMFNLRFAPREPPIDAAILGRADGVRAQLPALDDDFWTTNDGNLYAVGNGGVRDTLLIRVPYNGSSMSPPAGFAALHRDGYAASVPTSPVVEFLTGAAVANPDTVFVGGNGGSYLFMNRISAGFGGSPKRPARMEGVFEPSSGVSSGISVDTRLPGLANIYFGTAGGRVQSAILQLAQRF
jgi:hypothetical protein